MQNSDPRGLYAVIGVSPVATAEEIKNAFRRRAKETHPDTSSNPSATLFQQVNAAYKILSDPEARAEYDSSGYQASAEEVRHKQLDPVCCSRCKQATAQPRYVVFRRVYSFILATIRTPVQGIFCASCARKEAFRSSLITMCTGWWGVPWGPIYTIGVILGNGFGGEYSKEAEERLTWYNCLAFLSRGNVDLAYSLAQMSRKASDPEISSRATELSRELEKTGVDPKRSRLKNPWNFGLVERLKHLAMVAAVPLVVAGIFMQDQIASWWTGRPVPRPSYTSTYTPPPRTTKAVPAKIVPVTNACSTRPRNGDALDGYGNAISSQGHVLEIRNGSGGPAIVKVRDSFSNRTIASFYISDNAAAEYPGIPDGSYRIQYAVGDELRSDCRSFFNTAAVGQFPNVERLQTERTSTQIITQHLTYTLYAVASGNVRPQSLSMEAFDAP
ncbi:J domain-containing protein [Mesorhizobium salmacidum]|uniref:J domain-containing protein n=1 Tax=Mesorhizobium salmacidum TaxID=3015171 RepID=A0ABU8KPK8_9HYPH